MMQEYLKELNNIQDDYLVEMAIINPQACKQASIHIELEQRDEGPIPHLHVYLDKTRNRKNCSYIRLDKAEYAKHHKDGKHITGKAKDEFISIMSNFWDKEFIQSIYSDTIRKATGYEAAVKTWIDTFGEKVPFNYDSDGFPIMPDYSKL